MPEHFLDIFFTKSKVQPGVPNIKKNFEIRGGGVNFLAATFYGYFKVCSHDSILSDAIHFWRMECSLLLIKQHCIVFSCYAADCAGHIHRKSADYKTSFKSELEPTKLDRVNRPFESYA